MSSENTQPTTPAAEEWRDCVGFPGYQVSNWGNVRSCDRTITTTNGYLRLYTGRLLRLQTNDDGYQVAHLSICGVTWRKFVHVLVAHAFIGEPPAPGGHPAEVHHKNRNRRDNHISNLVYRPGKEHLSEHFTGANNPAAKLSDEKIATMQRLIRAGKSQRQIAQILQVNQSTICRAATGETWKHVHQPARPAVHPAQMDLFLEFNLADVAELEF